MNTTLVCEPTTYSYRLMVIGYMKMNILDLHGQFCQECLLIRNYSPATVKWYRDCMKAFLKRVSVVVLDEITTEVLRNYLYERRLSGTWGADTFLHNYKGLKAFLKWCVGRGYMAENPIAPIDKPKLSMKLPKRITSQEALRVIEYAFNMRYPYRFERYRNRAIFAVMIYAGLRCGELINLQKLDVNLETGNMLIRSGKGNKDRNVPIHYKLKYALKRYLDECKRLHKQSEYLFVGAQSGKPLLYKDVLRICNKVSKASGVSFTPHCLRHTFGSVSVEQGIGLPQLQAIMGHASIMSTMIYVKMNSKALKESLDKVELF